MTTDSIKNAERRSHRWVSGPRAVTAAALAVVTGVVAGCGPAESASGPTPAPVATLTAASVTLTGAGANSIDPFFERVFYDYHQKNAGTSVRYSPAGSSVGVKDIEEETVDFGDTEIPMSSKDLAKATAGSLLQIPVVLGGVAISYNLPGATKALRLDGATLAGIFDGSISHWNDARIAAVSGQAHLPNLPIVAVHRADSSGPGWDLDAYLIKAAPSWSAKIGATKPSKTWPLATIGIGQQLNSGVANYIHQTPGAIGYVEYGYALQSGFTNVAVKNRSGAFVAPSLHSIGSAGGHAATLSASKFSIIDEPGTESYPLANFSWTVVYKKQADAAKGAAIRRLIGYVVMSGQADAAPLGYAPLPSNVVALAQRTLSKLQVGGESPQPPS